MKPYTKLLGGQFARFTARAVGLTLLATVSLIPLRGQLNEGVPNTESATRNSFQTFSNDNNTAVAAKPQPPHLPLRNSTIKTLKGKYDLMTAALAEQSGSYVGCEITLKLERNQKAIEARGVSRPRFDAATGTCEGEFEVGEPQEEILRWDYANLKVGPQNAGIDRNGDKSTRKSLDGYTTSAGYLYVSFVDPAGITVNYLTNYLTWYWPNDPYNPYPPQVYPASVNGYEEYWFTWSGWYKNYSNWGATYTGSSIGTLSNASFSNYLFPACLGGTATANYNSIHIYGWWNGELHHSGGWTISGPVTCIYLLTPVHRLVRTLN